MNKLIFIDNKPYLETIQSELEKEFVVIWYPSVHDFQQNLFDKSDIAAIVICESFPGIISSIRNNLVFTRHYGNEQPIVILSFLPITHIKNNKEYNLSEFQLDDAHKYIQLPAAGNEIIKNLITAKKCDTQPEDLPYVKANQQLIDHILYRVNQNNIEFSKAPIHKILVVEDNPSDISIASSNIIKYLEEKIFDFKLLIKYVQRGDEVENLIRTDTDIQSVLLDWLLLEKSGAKQTLSETRLVNLIHSIRPELPIYIFTLSENPYEIINECGNRIKTYFTKKQFYSDPISVFNRIVSDYNKRRKAPFWEAYKNYIEESNDSWHTPGHARGVSFRESPYLNDFYNYFGVNMFGADLSVSVEKLGSLLDSTYSIREAQEKAAKTFSSKRVFFATNGSSTSNKIIIQTMLRPGDGVVIDRNCHKSVHYGVIQAGVGHVTYLNSEYSNKYRIFAPPSLEEIKRGIKDAQEKCKEKGIHLKALIITGCTYDGLLIDIKQVVKVAHDEGLKVFIDEAWFAYSQFHPEYRKYSAIDAEADYVTHSVHKVLSAFSQASIIHVNDPDFDEDYFREIFYIYTSTSPQYHMLASIDVAVMQMEMEGFKKITDALKLAKKFRESVNKTLNKIKVLDTNDFSKEFPHIVSDNIGHDTLKVLMDMSDLNYDVEEIHRHLFEEGGLEIEKDTATTILVLFTMGTSPDKTGRLYKALKDLDDGNVNLNPKKGSKLIEYKFTNIDLLGKPADAFFTHKRERIKINDLINLIGTEKYVSTNLVTPYPPGIPFLIPNQIITKEHLELINELIKEKVNIHGCHDDKIWVAKSNEINTKE